MNYISRLQAEVASLEQEVRAMRDAAADFRAHLAGAKFQGFEEDGDRKDWIAVADAAAYVTRILAAGR